MIYCYDTWSVALLMKHRLRVFETGSWGKYLDRKWWEWGNGRKFHIEEHSLHPLSLYLDCSRGIKSRRTMGTRNVDGKAFNLLFSVLFEPIVSFYCPQICIFTSPDKSSLKYFQIYLANLWFWSRSNKRSNWSFLYDLNSVLFVGKLDCIKSIFTDMLY
jgi:hypothetical protein